MKHYNLMSLTQPFEVTQTKSAPKDLLNVLADPNNYVAIHPGLGKVYLGSAAKDPAQAQRYPLWLPISIFDSHILMAGGIGSGKTTILHRLIAGALKNYGSVIIGEAKAGLDGGEKGAAFAELARYMQKKLPDIKVYRWPRGNCWFNPLLYLKNNQDRRIFLDSICNQVSVIYNAQGDMLPLVFNAGNIAEQILIVMEDFLPEHERTLRTLVRYLRDPEEFNSLLRRLNQQSEPRTSERIQKIGVRLAMMNFFRLKRPELVASRHGVNLFAQTLEHDDLLDYTEPKDGVPSITLDEILYEHALVIVSQPLHDPSSKIVGPLFWDSLLAKIIELGPNPAPRQGKARRNILAVLDETHRLPTGRLGDSGDFLREYRLGLLEITPAIVDVERWQQNKHVYQTVISLCPGVPDAVELVHSRLPNHIPKPVSINNRSSHDGSSRLDWGVNADFRAYIGKDNPGTSARSIQMAGRYTALIQSFALNEHGQLFFLDFSQDVLLAKVKDLLQQANQPNCPLEIIRLLDHTLGLEEHQ